MPRKTKEGKAQLALLEAKVATAPCVPAIREKVKEWSKGGRYAGVTDTTRLLLNYWFHTDQR